MKSRDFCYWLQGYFELNADGDTPPALSPEQVFCIRKHLAMVFKHEIDPGMGGAGHQDTLNSLHNLQPMNLKYEPGARC